MRQLLAVVFLLILLAHTAGSQPRDFKISPPEPITFALPDSIRVQAADACGPFAVVVWGSNRRLADSTLVTCLWAQIYLDSIKVGLPFRVHSDDARPSWTMSVCVTADRFLVAWNDARIGSPGVYYAIFDTLGRSISSEQHVPEMENDVFFFRVLPSSTNAFVIVASAYHQPNRTFHSQAIAPGGQLVGNTKQLGAGGPNILSSATLLSVAEGLDGWLLQLDGKWFAVGRRIDSLREVSIPLCGLFVVSDDGGVMTVCGDSLRRYSSLFGHGPIAVARVPLVDGLKLLGVAPAASGDSLMLFGVTHIDSGVTIDEQFIRVHLTGALAPTRADTLSKVRLGPISGLNHSGTTAQRVCSSGVRITVTYVYTQLGYHNRPEQRSTSRMFQTDSHGRSIVGDVQLVSCDPATVIRQKSDTASSVLFMGDTLSVPTSKVILNRPQRTPALDISDDRVRIVWYEPATAQYVVRIWPSIADTTTSLVASMQVARISTQSGYTRDSYWSVDKTYSLSGRAAITSQHEEDEHWKGLGDRYVDSHFSTYSVYIPLDSAWVRTLLREEGGYDWYSMFRPSPISIDPESRRVTGGIAYDGRWAEHPGFELFSFDERGLVIDTMRTAKSFGVGTYVLYDKPQQYLLCDLNAIHCINRDTLLTIGQFPTKAISARIQRLMGRQFLRLWRDTSNMQNLFIERYNFAGIREANTILHLGSKAGQFEVAEGRDGRLYVVHADTSIHVYVLDRNLNVVSGDARVSADDARAKNPNVLIHHDTLIVVWEDERNQGYDVYAIAMPVDDIRARIETPRRATMTMIDLISPLPASDYIDIALSSLAPFALEVRLYDINTRVCSSGQIAVGAKGTRLNVSACATGVYVLDVRSHDHHEQRRVVIVR